MVRFNEDGLSQPLLPTGNAPARPLSIPLLKRRRSTLHRFVYISLCIIGVAATALGGLYVTSSVVFGQRQLYEHHSAFSPPLRPNPVHIENLVAPISYFAPPGLDELRNELNSRFRSIGLENATLKCPAVGREEDFAAGEERYLLALNLYNSQNVLPTLASTLLIVSSLLGASNIHISIFENGSQDLTRMALAHFAAVLTAGGIAHTIRSDSRRTDWSQVDRIAQLSEFRNLLLSPLDPSGSNRREGVGEDEGAYGDGAWRDEREFGTVVFLNDIFTCPGDVMKLLREKRENGAHAACAMDWRKSSPPVLSWFGWGDVKFYDNWVSRTISGNTFRPRFDVWAEYKIGLDLFTSTTDSASQRAFLSGRPFPVYSCWNGMIALDARAFRGVESGNAGAKQTERGAVRFRSAEAGECRASECKTIARDFWARGFDRWIIVPTVRVTYDLATYHHPTLVDLSTRDRRADTRTVIERRDDVQTKIDWEKVAPPEAVACYSWTSGLQIDLPFRRTMEPPW